MSGLSGSTNADTSAPGGYFSTTVNGYLEILQETLLCFQLPAYETKLRVRERKLPKLYWCDPGIVRAMKRQHGEPSPEERVALFEGLVVQLVRACLDYRHLCDDLYYWGAGGKSGVEVDLLLARDNRFLAVEIKSGKTFSETWCKGLRAIAPLPGLARRCVVYPNGPPLQTEDGIDVLPFNEFAQLAASEDLWPS